MRLSVSEARMDVLVVNRALVAPKRASKFVIFIFIVLFLLFVISFVACFLVCWRFASRRDFVAHPLARVLEPVLQLVGGCP